MPSSTKLDFIHLQAYNTYNLAIADISQYNNNIVSPTREITPPGFPMKSIVYTPSTIEVYNSNTLGITCSEDLCDIVPLPDGIYKIRQTVNPSATYYVEKTFLKVDRFYEKFDKAYLKLDILQCDNQLKAQNKKVLDNIEFYIQGAIAAANSCALKLAMDLYRRALEVLENYLKTQNCC